jgi:hypothetical protein
VSYVGLQRYSVTFCTAFRKPTFEDFTVGKDVVSQILQAALENPVRAGLAKALGEWPLAGSSVYTWPELFTLWEQ